MKIQCSESIYHLQYKSKNSNFQNFIGQSFSKFISNDWGYQSSSIVRQNEEQFQTNRPIIGIYEKNDITIQIILKEGHIQEKNYLIILTSEIEKIKELNFKLISQGI